MKKHLSLIAPLTLAAYPISAQITFIEITDDTNSGISSEMTFTHAIDFGASGTANVNGVIFANDVNIAADIVLHRRVSNGDGTVTSTWRSTKTLSPTIRQFFRLRASLK
nr:hypothetical protein [bacterium]